MQLNNPPQSEIDRKNRVKQLLNTAIANSNHSSNTPDITYHTSLTMNDIFTVYENLSNPEIRQAFRVALPLVPENELVELFNRFATLYEVVEEICYHYGIEEFTVTVGEDTAVVVQTIEIS